MIASSFGLFNLKCLKIWGKKLRVHVPFFFLLFYVTDDRFVSGKIRVRQARTEGMMQSAAESTASAANSAQMTAQRGADQSAGFMQQVDCSLH